MRRTFDAVLPPFQPIIDEMTRQNYQTASFGLTVDANVNMSVGSVDMSESVRIALRAFKRLWPDAFPRNPLQIHVEDLTPDAWLSAIHFIQVPYQAGVMHVAMPMDVDGESMGQMFVLQMPGFLCMHGHAHAYIKNRKWR